tara:strand:+ start:29 stop:682 length:654 start_codon:yes stop_codon:yes gene_type:complete
MKNIELKKLQKLLISNTPLIFVILLLLVVFMLFNKKKEKFNIGAQMNKWDKMRMTANNLRDVGRATTRAAIQTSQNSTQIESVPVQNTNSTRTSKINRTKTEMERTKKVFDDALARWMSTQNRWSALGENNDTLMESIALSNIINSGCIRWDLDDAATENEKIACEESDMKEAQHNYAEAVQQYRLAMTPEIYQSGRARIPGRPGRPVRATQTLKPK